MAFDRHTGDWTPQRREWVAAASDAAEAEAGPAPSAACDRWQAAIASGRMTAAELGLVIVETLFGHGAAAAPATAATAATAAASAATAATAAASATADRHLGRQQARGAG